MEISEAYSILGFENKIPTKDEIKVAYRELSKKYHPDKKGGSEYYQQLLNRAYECTNNKDKPKKENNAAVEKKLREIISLALVEDFKNFQNGNENLSKDTYLKCCHKQIELTEKNIYDSKKMFKSLKMFKEDCLKKYKKDFYVYDFINNDIKGFIKLIRKENQNRIILKKCEKLIKEKIIYEPKKQNNNMWELYNKDIVDSLSSVYRVGAF